MLARIAIVPVLLLTVAAFADRPAVDPASIIAPLVDDNTIAVARLDTSRLDPATLAKQAVDLGLIDAEDGDSVREKLTKARDLFARAGGRDVYFLAHLADLPVQPFTVAIPLADGADVPALTALLRMSPLLQGNKIETVSKFLVIGEAPSIERLKKNKPIARANLTAAFAATGDCSLQIALLPPPDLRRVMEELMPKLPQEIGGGSSTILTRGVQWLGAGVNFPPKGDLRIVVQAPDAAAAKALQETVTAGLAFGVKEVLARQQPADPMDPARLDPLSLTRSALALKPVIKGDQLVLSASEKAFTELAPQFARLVLGPSIRARGINNLKMIALACHSFYTVHQRLPANIVDKNGKPLLSWRVAILPYLEQTRLYQQFRLDESWDSENNKKLLAMMPAVYRRSSSRAERDRTTYLMPAGKDTVLADNVNGLYLQPENRLGSSPDPKKTGVRFQDITDGTSNTLLVADVTDALSVDWTKPDDWLPDPSNPRKGVVGSSPGGFLAAFADGSVRFIPARVSAKTIKLIITRNDGEVLPSDF